MIVFDLKIKGIDVVKIGNFSNIVLLKELMFICFFILIKYNEFVF